MTVYRILVTGSRTWTDRAVIEAAVTWWSAVRADVVVVHGDCPSGADRIAKETAIALGVPHEPHRPRWEAGLSAGPDRNQEMVDAGADVCLAFASICLIRDCRRKPVQHTSHGTADCMRRVRAAGIPVQVYGFVAPAEEVEHG